MPPPPIAGKTPPALPSELLEWAKAEAKRQKTTIHEIVQQRLATHPDRSRRGRSPIFAAEPFHDDAPADLSENIDHYLYGRDKRK